MRRRDTICLTACLAVFSGPSFGDGVIIDALYHPYVEAGERELEYRATLQESTPGLHGHRSVHRFSYGQSVGDRWFLEAYLIGEDYRNDTIQVDAVEFEALRQLTEQGEFWADWAVLLELEKELHYEAWEASVGLIAEKEWGRWSTTANLFLIQEWGEVVDDELESRLALQARYRMKPAFEPAVEFHSGENTRALGPALTGSWRFSGRRQLSWSGALLFGLDSQSPDKALRFEFEYEF